MPLFFKDMRCNRWTKRIEFLALRFKTVFQTYATPSGCLSVHIEDLKREMEISTLLRLQQFLSRMLEDGALSSLMEDDDQLELCAADWFLYTGPTVVQTMRNQEDDDREPSNSRPMYPSDVRHNERRREERKTNGHYAATPPDSAGVVRQTTPHAGAPASDQIRSDQMDSDSYINQSIQSNPIQSNQIGESENHQPPLTIITAEGIPEGFAALADDLRRDTEGWTEPELVEACRRMVAKGEKVKRPLWYLRTTLKNLRAEWAQQQMVLLAQEKEQRNKTGGESTTGRSPGLLSNCPSALQKPPKIAPIAPLEPPCKTPPPPGMLSVDAILKNPQFRQTDGANSSRALQEGGNHASG